MPADSCAAAADVLNMPIIIKADVAVNALLIAAAPRCYRKQRDAIILFVSVPVKAERSGREDVADVRARIRELETALGERIADVARTKVELAAFRVHYQDRVGRLYEELDELEAAIAKAELGEIAKRMEGETSEASRAAAPSEPLPRYTSDAVRKLFRDVAKAIHPDLAEDEVARDRRHALMIEANRAYALGDEERLRWILQSWESSPEAVAEGDPEAERLRLERRIAQLEDQITFAAGDMVARLKVDIMTARHRLHAIEWRP